MKRALWLILVFAFMLPNAAYAANDITVTIDSVPVAFEMPPQIINDRVMVQIRAIVERLGCTVEWDDATQTSYINQPGVPLSMTAVKGQDINVYVNNQPVEFPDQKPVLYHDYVLIPSRGVIEALGYSVEWNDTTQTQAISTITGLATPPSTIPVKPDVTASPTPKPVTPVITATPTPMPMPKTSDGYIGNLNTHVFHYPDCSSVQRMSEKNKVYLPNRETAINDGYVPCQICKP